MTMAEPKSTSAEQTPEPAPESPTRQDAPPAASAESTAPPTEPAEIADEQAVDEPTSKAPALGEAISNPTPSPGAAQNKTAAGAAEPAKLPAYTCSLLKIPVAVSVTLAIKKAPLAQIVSLAPGSIIQFDKSCEDLLELCISGRTLADGEAVKVGDKFGLRINSIVLPKERFHRVSAARSMSAADASTSSPPG